MNVIDTLAQSVRFYDKGIITAQEFVGKLTDCFAGDEDFNAKHAVDVAALIPPSLRTLMVSGSTPHCLRDTSDGLSRWGRKRREDEERADALRETAREKAWAAALKPFLS
jgi:hypothetical protein